MPMGFAFGSVCNLLSQLDSNRALKATTTAKKFDPDAATISSWFRRHEKAIHNGKTDRLALLSCLFPAKRPDRVYGLREPSLVKVIGRCLLLGASRKQELDLWRERGRGDLGECVENVMRRAENHIEGWQEVTVEEVDLALAQIASSCRFSGPNVRRSHSAVSVDDALAPIFRRLSSRDAKWFTRLILKDYGPIEVPEKLVLRRFHFMMPTLLTFQDSMDAALKLLSREPMASFPANPSRDYAEYLMRNAIARLSPQIGVKIGRPGFYKARGLKHCCSLAGNRTMSLEKKYDGEYCQIHIDMSRGSRCIQIFSKSGKDSTRDRSGIHRAIKECLRIGKPDCKFKRQCILEGELLVWGVEEAAILPFYKLRKHVSRSGSFIGADNDSPPNPNERLYIVFFDILLLDDDVCLSKSYTERRDILSEVVSPIDGVGALAEQVTVNFARPDAFERLKAIFSMVAAQRWEGLVLKGSHEPYFTLKQYTPGDHPGHWIKMKKEYITGLGDTADFAIIGARYDSADAANFHVVKPLFWTSFYIGCLDNPDTTATRPVFRVVDILGRDSMMPQIIHLLNQHGQFHAHDVGSDNPPFTLNVDQTQLPRMDVIFRKPFVVELTGFGFERPPNVRYFTLRFPRVVKVHLDRTFRDAISFEELRQLAEAARTVPEEELTQEMAMWADRLDPNGANTEYIVDSSEASLQSARQSSQYHSSVLSSSFQENPKRVPVVDGTPERPKRRKLSMHSTSFIVLEDSPSSPSPGNKLVQDDAPARHLADLSNVPSTQQSHVSESQSVVHGQWMHQTPSQYTDNQENVITVASSIKTQTSQSNPPVGTAAVEPISTTDVQIRRSAKPVNRSKRFSPSIPILIGSTVAEKTDRIQQYLAKRKAMATTSPAEFLDLLSARHQIEKFRDAAKQQNVLVQPERKSATQNTPKQDSPKSTPSRHTIGLVLVGSNSSQSEESSSSKIADEVILIGNSLTSRFRNADLTATGKVLFLHWEVLRLATLFGSARTPDLETRVKQVFAACLKWGRDVVPRKRHEVHSRETRKGENVGHFVAASWDWEESLSLFCENK